MLPRVRPRSTVSSPHPVISTSNHHVTRRLSSPTPLHLTLHGRPSLRSTLPLGQPPWSAPLAVGPPRIRPSHSANLRGRPPSRLALLVVDPPTRPTFAVDSPRDRPFHSVTLHGRTTSRSVHPLGHPCRSTSILPIPNTLIYFINIPFVGLQLHSGMGDY